MPELRLDDGTILALPDDATPAEIAEIVAARYGVETPVEAPPAPRARCSPRPPEDAPPDAPIASIAVSDAPASPLVTVVPGIGLALGDYRHDDERDPDALREQRIRELQRRAGATPDPLHRVHDPPPADNPGRDNMHSTWSRRR